MHGKEDNMSVLENLRETAGLGGPAAQLANELLVIRENYEQGNYSADEYQFLINEIAEIRAQQDIANDEMACRFICQAAQLLMSM